MLFVVTHLWYGTEDIDFEIKFLFSMNKVLQGLWLWLEVDLVTLSGLPLIQTKGLLK